MAANSYASLGPEDLRRAIESGELSLHYQPKIALETGGLIGVEALARWFHPRIGAVPPSHFIPLAEASRLIDDLTEAVFAIAAAQGAEWLRSGFATNIAVNVSARNLSRLEFPDVVEAICARHALPCRHLTVELTESATQSVAHLLDTLTRLRLKGMLLSLDDFGTGYSSLVQLHQLPFSEMKIDRSFVIGMESSRECRTIVKAVIDLAHNLELGVVAEGVETAGALAQLRDLGCDAAQGYFIARPMPAADLETWFAAAAVITKPATG